MEILFLANRVPYPPFRGDKLKIYNLGRRLAGRHTIHLLAFAETKKDLTYKSELEQVFDSVTFVYQPKWKSYLNSAINFLRSEPFQLAYFRSNEMRRTLAKFLQSHEIDVIHTQHLRMSQYTKDLKQYPRILDLPDAYSLYWQRREQVERPLLNRLFDKLESKRVIRAEKVLYEYDMALVCSVEDRDHLLNLHKESNVRLLRNGVDLETFTYKDHDYSRDQTLLFTGNMDYAPNVDAVTHFVRTLFPEILKHHPETRLVIAGQRPVKQVMDLKSDNIEITGFVEDLSVMYDEADVVIAPLRFGAGTQNKVLEAMAMGVPVVCTDIGFKGLEIESGEGVIHAPEDKEFIDQVVGLLKSEDLRRQVGQKGLELARNKFSWDGISKELEVHFKTVLDEFH